MVPGTRSEPQRPAIFGPGRYRGIAKQRALCSSHIISELHRSLEPPGQGLETPNSPQRAWIEKDLLFFFSFMLLD